MVVSAVAIMKSIPRLMRFGSRSARINGLIGWTYSSFGYGTTDSNMFMLALHLSPGTTALPSKAGIELVLLKRSGCDPKRPLIAAIKSID